MCDANLATTDQNDGPADSLDAPARVSGLACVLHGDR